LGYSPDARLVIINCDDLGATRAANVGVFDALRRGYATSASLMAPAPWARNAAAMWRGEDVGVHLTLTSELENYRWAPLTHAPSLLDGDGGFPRTLTDLWEHADLHEVRRECQAQIERAILWGFDVSHLDSHMHSLQMRPEFFDVFIELALEYQLPVRLRGADLEATAGFPFRKLARAEGLIFPDHFVESGGTTRRAFERALFDLHAGVTELYLHPCADADELRASYNDWAQRADDHQFVCSPTDLGDLITRAGATLIGYRALRDLQRS